MKILKNKNLLALVIINIGVLCASLIYNQLFKGGHIGQCAFLDTFGFYCPGCGGSRSLFALLNFDLVKSFIYYPPILITTIILLYVDIRLFISFIHRSENFPRISYKIFLIIPIAIIANFLIRDILLFSGIDLLGDVIK